MKQGNCPKCGSARIYHGQSEDGEGLSAGSYPALIELVAGSSHTTLWIDTYVCGGCGFIEQYIANRNDLGALAQAEGWQRAYRSIDQ